MMSQLRVLVVVVAMGWSAPTFADVLTGCLGPGGQLTRVAMGNAPAEACPGAHTQVSWGGPAGGGTATDLDCTGCVTTPKIANQAVNGAKVAAASLGLDRLQNYFTVSGSVVLTQPEFLVAGFNQVIAEVNLTAADPIIDPATETFEPFVLVSVLPSAPDDPTVKEYGGEISWQHVVQNFPPGSFTPRQLAHKLQFRLETRPQPPLPDGTQPAEDPASPGSQVKVHYQAVFLRFSTP